MRTTRDCPNSYLTQRELVLNWVEGPVSWSQAKCITGNKLQTSDREIFADVSGKKRQGKKGKGVKLRRKEGKRRKIVKREGGKLKKEGWKVTKWQIEERIFFPFAFHFWKRRKFVLGLPKWEFSTGKNISRRGKYQEKWLCPLRKICLLRPCNKLNKVSLLEKNVW